MTFFEREFRKIVGTQHPGAAYGGQVCSIPLTPSLRGRICFLSMKTPGVFDSIEVMVIDNKKGPVDWTHISLSALIKPKSVRGRERKPTILYMGDESRWSYGCKPDATDYKRLSNAVESYLSEFQEQTQAEQPSQQMGMSM